MSDCSNVEMRELLPEYLHQVLDARARARVEAHLASCEDCTVELETMRAVRMALSRTPPIDTRSIVAALPRPAARVARSARHFPMWRVAAALTMVSVGGLSLVLARKAYTPEPMTAKAVAVAPTPPAAGTAATPNVSPSGAAATTAAPASAEPALSFGGGVDDLENADIEALIAAVDGLDVALAVEPEPSSPIVPAGDTTR